MRQRQHVTSTLFAAVLLALLAACQTTPSGPGPASGARAERLVRQGNHAEAARMYEDLATANPAPERDQFALAATRAWLDANRADDAQRALNLAGTQLPAAQQFERELLQVEVAAARGQYQAAWQQVSQMREPARAQDASRLFYLRQQVGVRAGQPAAAVQAGIARERVAADDNGATRARRDLLHDLRGAIDRGLRVSPADSRDPMERGWIEIAQIASEAGRNPLGANAMIDRWRQRFPGHPASTIVVSEILDPASRPDAAGNRLSPVGGPVALLLPLADRRAMQIREGFRAGAARLPDAGLADVRVYDTSAMPVAAALQRAVAEGAAFVVGPLLREEVQTAAEQRPSNVPMLLLNTLAGGGSAGAGTWQYALAPEDEARQIARHIAGSGGRNVVVLAPSGDWGPRVAAAFTDEFAHAGGRVLAEGIYSYGAGANTIESTITLALGIDGSRARHQRVQQVAGTRLQFEPRPLPEIHAVFVAGWQPEALRQIRPFLRHYNAQDIPTYMTSDGVAVERTANRDLEGMRLLEMPWTLDSVGAAYDARLATEATWSRSGGLRDSRLFAFGYDAAMLAASLRGGMVAWPLTGVTGRLSLAADGRIERQLNWARVLRDGNIVPADPLAP